MNLNRYNRQIILAGFGPQAQTALSNSKVLVVGAGGLGVPVLTYLNAMGVGSIGIIDGDRVSLSNLHRQVLFAEIDVGRHKADAALEKLKAQNSETRLLVHKMFLTKENALQTMNDYDVIVDASDNFPTRYLINDACVILKKPFVYGALHAFEGQVSVFNYQNGPTYRCLYPTLPKPNEVPDCNENGVLGVLPGIIGNLQALETVKLITGLGKTLSGKLLLFDGLANTFQKIAFSAKSEHLRRETLEPEYGFECGNDVENTNVNGTTFNTVDAATFLSLAEFENTQLIDVRTPREFVRNHLQISINIPLSELELRQDEINFERKIYVVCQSGIRSKKAIAQILGRRPDAILINIAGGMTQISKHGVAN